MSAIRQATAFYVPRFVRTLLLAVAIGVLQASVAYAADPGELAKRMNGVRIGDAEARVLAMLERAPDREQRSNVLGIVQKCVLEFDAGPSSHELTFYAGHLVAKTLRTRKPGFFDRLRPGSGPSTRPAPAMTAAPMSSLFAPLLSGGVHVHAN